jgi:DNA-binding NtrC family response regulator
MSEQPAAPIPENRPAGSPGAGHPPPRVLVADDQSDVVEALRLLLKGEGCEVGSARSPAGVLEAVQGGAWDVLLVDLNYARDTTSGQEGLDLLARLREIDPGLPVVVMTAWASVDLAVEAMRHGARDFVQKPWENARLLAILKTQIELARALRHGRRLEAENRALSDAGPGDEFVADSAAMQPIVQMIARVAPSEAHVLITGENGTGKSLVARAIHARSARVAGRMVTVNAGGLAEGVFESELFGHVRGAFTDARADRVGRFELADGGTLFLDEIANLGPAMQARLLRVLETGEFEPVGSSRTRRVDVRVLSATNADIAAEVAAGRFRRDLLFRLNTVEIRMPALRERREDILTLARLFLARHARRYRKPVEGFDEEAARLLLSHPWPGNVRELDHAIERAVLLGDGGTLRAVDLGLTTSGDVRASLEEMSLEEVEALLIRKALARCGGNVSQAAAALGLSRSALYRRLQRHAL